MATDIKYNLLLHACCGPCTEWPARQLIAQGFCLLGWFYNPNIQPLAENNRRRDNFLKLADILSIDALATPGCEPEIWQNWHAAEETRCRMCYRRRLEAAAQKASMMGIPAFTTTLLVSPWQDHEAIRETGKIAAAKYGVSFIDQDFRDGYRQGQQMAREDGLYRQRYCGCLPSLEQSDFKEKILRDLEALSD